MEILKAAAIISCLICAFLFALSAVLNAFDRRSPEPVGQELISATLAIVLAALLGKFL